MAFNFIPKNYAEVAGKAMYKTHVEDYFKLFNYFNENFQKILDYYNSKKDENDEPLERLDRCEGGFKIQLSYMKNYFGDENKRIKQLRWNKGYLLSKGYICFKYKEEMLLFEALVNVLGSDNVIFEKWNECTNIFDILI